MFANKVPCNATHKFNDIMKLHFKKKIYGRISEASIVSSAVASNQELLKTVPEDQEDEGVVICTVTDVRTDQRDFLLIVDARNMTELARSNFDVDIPMSSHSIVASVE